MSDFPHGSGPAPDQSQFFFQGAGKLRASLGSRDLFPLPLPASVHQSCSLSRRSQQRLDRKRQLEEDVREATKGLNWMNGFSPNFEFDDVEPDPMQQDVLDRVRHLCKTAVDVGTFAKVDHPEAALKALLQGRSEYHDHDFPVSLARFDLERISLPETLEGVPEVASVLPEEARQYLNSSEHMVKNDELREEPIVPYYDPALKIRRNYRSLIEKLHKLGYLRYTRSPKARAGIFFVHKSDGRKIRMIVDARPANQLFKAPPGVQLCTSEGFSRMEIEVPPDLTPGSDEFSAYLKERGLYFGLADVKDCFHRLRQPRWLSEYFCWDPIPAHWIPDMVGFELDGIPLDRGEQVFPMPASLCMGFSWSLYFAQMANEHLMTRVPTLAGSTAVSDRGPPVVFKAEEIGAVRHYVYVDNLGIISPHRGIVQDGLKELGPEFDDRGLVWHPGEIQHEEIHALGVFMKGDLMAARISPKRHCRLKQAISGVLRRRKISGRLLEIVLGHITFCCLCNRQLLCIFSSIYKFVRRNYFEPVPLWDSVREELEAFRGLMVFLHSDWWRSWNPLVSSSDASLEGFGISTAFWPIEEVKRVGRQVERARFRRPSTTHARHSALGAAGFVQDELTKKWRNREIGDEEFVEASGWEVNPAFSEVPSELLAKQLWEPKLWGRWNFEAGILELEGRALVKSLKRVALSRFGKDIRQLLLVDNMAVALSFDRFRSRNYRLLRQIRRYSSYLLARNIAASVRWIPSEFNSSDEPSRFFSEEESKLLTHLLGFKHADLEEGQARDPLETPTPKAENPNGGEDRSPEGCLPQSSGIQQLNSGSPKPGSRSGLSEGILPAREVSALQSAGLGLAKLQRAGGQEEGALFVQYERDQPCQANQTEDPFSRPSGSSDGRWHLDTAGEECGWSSDFKELCQGVGRVQPVWYCKRTGLGERRECGQIGSGLPERDVLSRTPSLQRGSPSGQHFAPLPELWEVWSQAVTQMWRAVRGFRKLTPGKSRLAYPFPVWAAMANQLKLAGYLRMALFVLVSVSSYARPSELLRMRLFSLVRPVAGVSRSWGLLLSPEESEQRTKTGEFDVSISVDSPYLLPWIHRFFTHLKKGHPEEALWDFNYEEYRREFSKAAAVLGLEITPYQTRHSGPSIDRAKKWRSQHEVQKRGQWKSQKSISRYEKSARLAATFDSLPGALQTHCRLCEHDLSEIMCGTLQPHRFGGTRDSKASM